MKRQLSDIAAIKSMLAVIAAEWQFHLLDAGLMAEPKRPNIRHVATQTHQRVLAVTPTCLKTSLRLKQPGLSSLC